MKGNKGMLKAGNIKRLLAAIAVVVVLGISSAIGYCAEDEFKIVKTYPENAAEGMAYQNMSIKIWFNRDIKPEDSLKEANRKYKKYFSIQDEKGKELPVMVAFPKRKGGIFSKLSKDGDESKMLMVLVAIDQTGKEQAQPNTKYTFKIKKGLDLGSGNVIKEDKKVSFKTLNQSTANKVNIGMMVFMVGGMIVFSVVDNKKKQAAKNADDKKTPKPINPYKEAKRTGKPVEEIIKKNQKERQKAEARREKARLKNAVEKQENDKIIMDVNKPKHKFVDKGGSKRWKKLLDK